jgi:MFS transporter, DHA1 family, multidrug resistance protein
VARIAAGTQEDPAGAADGEVSIAVRTEAAHRMPHRHGSTRTASGRDHVPLLLVVVLATVNAAAPLSTDMYLSAMPRMAHDLGARPASVQLTLTTFMFGIAAGQLVIGSLSDRWGRRRPLLVSTVIFLVSSVLCAVAPSIGLLVALRFVQGFCGSAGMVIGRAVVADSVRGVAAARAFSLLMVVGSLAPVVAPVAGTGIDALAGWRAVFLTLALAGVVMLAGVALVVRETLPESQRVTGSALATVHLAREVLGNGTFLGYLTSLVFAFGALFAYVSASPFVVQGVLGLSPGQYALDFAVNSLGVIAGGVLSARLVGRSGPLRLLVAGTVTLVGAALGLLAVTTLDLISAGTVLPLLFLVTTSMGLIFGNGSSLAMAGVTRGAGTASAVLGSLQFGLGAVVSPLVGLAGEATAVPMAVVILVCATVSALSLALVARRSRPVVLVAVPTPRRPSGGLDVRGDHASPMLAFRTEEQIRDEGSAQCTSEAGSFSSS